MRGRSVARALLATCLVAVLGGCASEPVDGDAFPDWDVVDARAAERFDAQLALLDSAIEGSSPFRSDSSTDSTGISYLHATYGEESTGSQSVVAIRGNPASVFIQQTDADDGYTVDTLHIGGEAVDYLLLGDGYAGLAPTPWVEVPTVYGDPGEGDLTAGLRTMCFVDGFQTVCEVRDAITSTADSERGAEMRRSVHTEDDGSVFSETEVTLAAVLEDARILNLPPETVAEMSAEMLESFIPVSLWQDADGQLLKMELNGTVRGTAGAHDLVIQSGFEITGKATRKDFPTAPASADVTVVPADEVDAFYIEMGNLT
ncbi:hypothetical protein [Sanguibacter antarcticus]|uniref:Lipoprotein n=1 Tax=Sanguibacter antarcticus TaxID=372484 RepID=A0A2A9E9S4_9MICO|nr:hypothetical protein [Sanguibacter antarcticus]PFG34969.1 hypothetical protein ATL42_2901 [Sanguibacter antarcticus]